MVNFRESTLQCAIIKWARVHSKIEPRLETLYSIPNGAHTGRIKGLRLVREGLKKGMPDLCLPIKGAGGAHNLFLEVKLENTYPTRSQKECHKLLTNHGNHVVIVRSLDQAIDSFARHLRADF